MRKNGADGSDQSRATHGSKQARTYCTSYKSKACVCSSLSFFYSPSSFFFFAAMAHALPQYVVTRPYPAYPPGRSQASFSPILYPSQGSPQFLSQYYAQPQAQAFSHLTHAYPERIKPERRRPKYTRSKNGCLTCRKKKVKVRAEFLPHQPRACKGASGRAHAMGSHFNPSFARG